MEVPRLNAPSLSVPRLNSPKLKVPHLIAPGATNVYNRNRYSVQRQHVKDLGDLVLGKPFEGTLQLQHTLEDYDLHNWKYVPILNSILGLGIMIKERTLDPLSKGDVGTAIVNNLETLGGSLDTLSNPIKSLMPWAGGGSATDLAKSMGWADGEYRKQYQWDTGNFLLDIIGETISDPANWFTLGGKQLAATATDVLAATVRRSIKDVVGEGVEQTLTDQGVKVLSAAIEEAITKESDDTVASILKRLKQNRNQLEKQLRELRKYNANSIDIKKLEATLKDYRNLLDIDADKKVADLINDVRVSKGYHYYNILRRGSKLATSVDDVLTITSLGLSPLFGVGKLVFSSLYEHTFKSLWDSYVLSRKELDLKRAINNTPADFREVLHTIRKNNYNLRRSTYKSFENILARYNMTVEQLQELYATVYRNAPRATRLDKEAITKLFKQRLASIMPELRAVFYDGEYYTNLSKIKDITARKLNRVIDTPDIDKDIRALIENVSVEQFNDLYDALWESVVVSSAAEETMYMAFKRQVEEEVAKWFEITRPNALDKGRIGLKQLTYMERLEFIMSNYFEVNGVKYTLKELPQYLNALNNADPNLYIKVSSLLDYVGISLDNYDKVYSLVAAINKYSTNMYADVKQVNRLYNELQHVLKAAKTGEFLELEKLEKQYKTIARSFEGAKNVNLDYLDTDEFKRLAEQFVDTGIAYETIVDAITKYQYVAKIPEFNAELQKLYATYFNKEALDLAEGTYLEAAEPRSYYVNNVVRFRLNQLNLSDGTLDRDTLHRYILNVKELQTQVGRWVSDIKSDSVKFDRSTQRFILKLNDLLNTPKHTEIVLNLLDLFETSESSIYYMMLSKQGMFWMEHTKLVASMENWSKEHKEWFESIKDKDSAVRARLDEIIKHLHDEGMLEESQAMERIIASIESYMLVTNLLSTKLTNYKISKQFNDYLNGLLFNIFKLYDGREISSMYSKLDEVMEKYIEQLKFDWDANRINTDLYENNPPKVLTRAPQELTPEEMARYEELQTFADATGAEEFRAELNDLELKMSGGIIKEYPDYADFMHDLKANLKYALNDYIMQTARIAKDVHPNLPIAWGSNLFTESITKDMQYLGMQYEDVMQVLADTTKSPELLKDTQDFIIYTAADKINVSTITTRKERLNILTELYGKDNWDAYVKDELILYLSGVRGEGTLHSIIRESFADIKEINLKLQHSQGRPIKIKTSKGIRTINNVSAYITKDAFDKHVRENLNVANAYEWSTTNGMLAVKKLEKYDLVVLHKLDPEIIRMPDDIHNVYVSPECATFYTIFKQIYNDLKDYKYFKQTSIDAYRSALIELYSDPTIYWGPKNPEVYFRAASDKDIYAWYTFTKLKSFNKKTSIQFEEILHTKGHLNPTSAAKYDDKAKLTEAQQQQIQQGPQKRIYTFAERINYNEDPASLFVDLDDIQNKVINDDDVYDNIIANLPINRIHTVREFITKDLTQYYKSPDTMQDNMTNVINYFRQDVEALEKTRPLDKLMKETRTVKDLVQNKQQLELLYSYGITPDMQVTNTMVQRFMLEERCNALAMNVARWNPSELRSYIDYNTDGILIYHGTADFLNKFDKAELKKAGIQIDLVGTNDNIFVIRRTDDVVRPKCHTYEVPQYVFKEQQDIITNVFKENRDYFYWDGMDVPDELFTGYMLDLDDYETLLDSQALRSAVGDIGVRKTYAKIDDKGINNFYKKKILRPNVAMIGHYDSINKIYELGSETFLERGMEVPLASTRLYNNAFTGSLNAIKRVNTEHKYLHLFMNDDYSIKRMKHMFKNESDNTIASFFERGNYTAAIVREDRKGRPIVYKIHIRNKADLAKAIDAGAVCLPHEVYRSAVLAINEHTISNKVLKFYKQFIVATFKSMWLTTPGFLMRNFLDTTIYKNAATSGGIFDLYENVKYFSKATQLWKFYNDTQAAMLADGANKTLNKRIVRAYLRKLDPLAREQYMLIDMFAMSSASGGLSDALEEMLRLHNMSDGVSIEEMWLNFYDEKILYGSLSPVRWVNNINSQIEQSSRLGLFLKLIDEGEDITKAVRKVTETHFDYKLKEPGAQAMEEIFWFSTYPINNMFYYLNEGITKNPSMFKLQMDALEQSYNDGEYTWEDVRNSNFLKYHLLAGNLRIKIAGQNIMLKTGSSVMSFFTSLFSPFEEAGERLNPFIAVLLGIDEIDQLNPFNSFSYRLKQIAEGQSLLPSVYTKLYPKTEYKRKYYSNNYRYKSSWNPKPRKVSSYHRNMAYMNYKFTTDRYYFGRGKNIHRWLESTNAIEPNWYMNNYRQYRANGKYGRAIRKLKMPKEFRLSVSK